MATAPLVGAIFVAVTFAFAAPLAPVLTPPAGHTVAANATTGMSATVRVTSTSDGISLPRGIRLTFDKAPPTFPTGVSFVRNSTRMTTLQWRASSDLGNGTFRIYRKKDTGAYALATTLNQYTLIWSDSVARGSVYRYYLSAVDEAGNESLPSLRPAARVCPSRRPHRPMATARSSRGAGAGISAPAPSRRAARASSRASRWATTS